MEQNLQEAKVDFIGAGVIHEHNIRWYKEEVQKLKEAIRVVKNKRKIKEQKNESTVGCDRVIADYIDRLGRYQKWISICEKQEAKKIQLIQSSGIKTK
ncbi:MAG: hypothetical protein ACLRFI_02605 [Alphaproteobacteria bacterium]